MTERLRHVAAQLAPFAAVPIAALAETVTTGGACMHALTGGDLPELTGDHDVERALAAWLCGGCAVQRECLELELRWSGPVQVGVFGALPDEDRRALYPIWRARRLRGGQR